MRSPAYRFAAIVEPWPAGRGAAGGAVVFNTLALVCLTACGYIGEPLPPALNIPAPVADLAAIQRGPRLEIQFTLPGLTTEQLPLSSVEEIELRAGANRTEPFDVNTWAQSATRVPVTKLEPGPIQAATPSKDLAGSEAVLGVRMRNRKGRWSAWSNLVAMPIVEPAPTPVSANAESAPEGAKLTWQAPPGLKFRIVRDGKKLADTGTNEFADRTAEFGKDYVYQVIALRGAAESDPTAAIRITPKDTFPPATPAGLALIAGTQSAELAWERNTESDFASYRVYRADNGGPFTQIADSVPAPSYSDRAVESGKRYRYAISAVDLAGNESPHTEPASIAIP